MLEGTHPLRMASPPRSSGVKKLEDVLEDLQLLAQILLRLVPLLVCVDVRHFACVQADEAGKHAHVAEEGLWLLL